MPKSSPIPDKSPQAPRRLRRLNSVWTPRGRPIFFATICTANRQPWLANDEIHQAFRDFCARSTGRASVWIGKYVLMPDHLHVFVSAQGSQGLFRWVASVKGYLASIRRTQNIAGPAWQSGFFDHLLRGAESYGEKWNYVRMNPVRAGLVAKPEDWRYAGEINVLHW